MTTSVNSSSTAILLLDGGASGLKLTGEAVRSIKAAPGGSLERPRGRVRGRGGSDPRR